MTDSPAISPVPDKPRTSLAAVISVAAGCLGCLIVPGVVAIIAGVIGLRQTRDPAVRGRGLAIAGIVMGALFSITATGAAVSFYRSYTWGMEQVRHHLPLVINAGTYDEAKPSTTMTPDRWAALKRQTSPWGTLSNVSELLMTGQSVDGKENQMVLTGAATFTAAGGKLFEVTIDSQNDQVKIVDVTFK